MSDGQGGYSVTEIVTIMASGVAIVATAIIGVWRKVNGQSGKRRRVIRDGGSDSSILANRNPGANFSGDQSGQFSIWAVLGQAMERIERKQNETLQALAVEEGIHGRIADDTRDTHERVLKLEAVLAGLEKSNNRLADSIDRLAGKRI